MSPSPHEGVRLYALLAVAAYPIIERLWLRDSLGKNGLAEHARLANEGE